MQAYVLAQHVGERKGESFSVYWAVAEDSPVRSVADLKGRTVGVNVYGSGVYGQMAMILKQNGLDPERDIRLVETGFPGSEAALRAGRVDAAVMNQPFALRAESKGGIRKLFSLTDLMPNTVHIFEVCRKDFTDAHPELVKRYVKDLRTAMALAREDRAETLKVVSEVTRAPVDLLDGYLLTDKDFARSADARPDFEAIQQMLDQYQQLGMLPAKVDVAQFRRDDLIQ